jgi:hypothetical protein
MPQCRVLVVQPGWLHHAGETPAPQTETPAKIVADGEGEGGEFVVERRLRHEVMAHRIASGNLSAFALRFDGGLGFTPSRRLTVAVPTEEG